MPLFIKIDFRRNGRLGAWWSRDEITTWKWKEMSTLQDEGRIRDVLIGLADELDPVEEVEPAIEQEKTQ
jgi:hypothetical protein